MPHVLLSHLNLYFIQLLLANFHAINKELVVLRNKYKILKIKMMKINFGSKWHLIYWQLLVSSYYMHLMMLYKWVFYSHKCQIKKKKTHFNQKCKPSTLFTTISYTKHHIFCLFNPYLPWQSMHRKMANNLL